MQRVYASYSYSGVHRQNRAHFSRGRNKDYLIRSEKRSPYDTGSFEKPASGGDKQKNPQRGALYACLTILLLVLLYPVGLFLLWSRSLKWRLAPKMLITVITGFAFCLLAIFAINADTGNTKITAMQKDARAALSRVNEYTGDGVDAALAWVVDKYEDGKVQALAIWDAVKKPAAREGLKLYAMVEDNINAVKAEAPKLLLNEYKTRIGYIEPTPAPTPSARPTIAPTVRPTVVPTVVPTVLPQTTADPALTIPATASEPESAGQTDAIVLPAIKPASLAPVYFTPNGVRYHMTENCSGMMNAVSHTLKEADEANKAPCDACKTPSFSMIDCAELLWTDGKNVAHTTDECAEFDGDLYKLLPFEEVHRGAFRYCETCGADICEKYIEQNVIKYTTDAAALDENTRKVYAYEKSVTVYYMENYRYYHQDMRCDNFMMGDFVHSLYEALHIDLLSPCAKCAPLTEEAIIEQGLHESNSNT